jgi:hypothetical protein
MVLFKIYKNTIFSQQIDTVSQQQLFKNFFQIQLQKFDTNNQQNIKYKINKDNNNFDIFNNDKIRCKIAGKYIFMTYLDFLSNNPFTSDYFCTIYKNNIIVKQYNSNHITNFQDSFQFNTILDLNIDDNIYITVTPILDTIMQMDDTNIELDTSGSVIIVFKID